VASLQNSTDGKRRKARGRSKDTGAEIHVGRVVYWRGGGHKGGGEMKGEGRRSLDESNQRGISTRRRGGSLLPPQ